MMFSFTVKDAIKTPALNYLHLVGMDAKGNANIGDIITDGSNDYIITTIPMIRRDAVRKNGEVDICIPFTTNNLVGKHLYSK